MSDAPFFVSVSTGLLAMTSAWCGSNDRDEWCNSKGIALACLMNRDSECRRKLTMFSQRSTCVCRALAAKQNSASTFSFRCKITSDMTNDTLFKHRKTHLQISSTFFSAALSRHFRFSHLNRLYFVFSHRIFFHHRPFFISHIAQVSSPKKKIDASFSSAQKREKRKSESKTRQNRMKWFLCEKPRERLFRLCIKCTPRAATSIDFKVDTRVSRWYNITIIVCDMHAKVY